MTRSSSSSWKDGRSWEAEHAHGHARLSWRVVRAAWSPCSAGRLSPTRAPTNASLGDKILKAFIAEFRSCERSYSSIRLVGSQSRTRRTTARVPGPYRIPMSGWTPTATIRSKDSRA